MKILLDENISRSLQIDFAKHIVKTTAGMGWSGKKNGELLKLMLQYEFDALVTTDRNIKHQQNTSKSLLTIFILVTEDNRDETVQPLINSLRKKLNSGTIRKGIVEIKN